MFAGQINVVLLCLKSLVSGISYPGRSFQTIMQLGFEASVILHRYTIQARYLSVGWKNVLVSTLIAPGQMLNLHKTVDFQRYLNALDNYLLARFQWTLVTMKLAPSGEKVYIVFGVEPQTAGLYSTSTLRWTVYQAYFPVVSAMTSLCRLALCPGCVWKLIIFHDAIVGISSI